VHQTLEGHSDCVSAIAFSLDGKLLASASWDCTVRLWDSATGAVHQTLEGHSDCVSAIAFSLDGKLLASASWDCMVRLWDSATGVVHQTLEGHSGFVTTVAFSPDGKLVASASYDGTVRLWDSATGAARRSLVIDVAIRALSFSSDGQYLETDRGQLNISSLQSMSISKIFAKETWVAQEMENVLWLPSDYRATCSAVRNNILVLGHASGLVSFSEFDPANTPLRGGSKYS
jgi:WD40 repeat protein